MGEMAAQSGIANRVRSWRSRSGLVEGRWSALALGAIVVGAALRAGWVFWLHPPADHLYSDMQTYLTHAARLATGASLDPYDAFQPPGTALLLSVPLRLFGTGRAGLDAGAAVWWALSSLTPFVAWRLARLMLGAVAAALTAILVALNPLFIAYAGFFLSETPSIAFLLAGLWLAFRSERMHGRTALLVGLLGGVCAGASVANRPQFLLNALLVLIPFLPRRARNRAGIVAFAAGLAAVLAGIVTFNSIAANRLTGLSESGGVTFFIGQCDVRSVATRTATTSYRLDPPPALQRGGGRNYMFVGRQIWEDRFFYRQGFDCIRRDGLDHLSIFARSLADMTATTVPWPLSDERPLRQVAKTTNLLYSLLLPFIAGLALLSIVRRRAGWRGELVLLSQLACVVPVVLLFLGDPRFRIPYDVFGLALLASIVADRWFDGTRVGS